MLILILIIIVVLNHSQSICKGNNIDTESNGEQSNKLKAWMIEHGHNLKDSTFILLQNEGIETIDDLKHFTPKDFDNMCNNMNQKIVYLDRVKLRHILEEEDSLNKDKFVDPEEIKSINNIRNEINKLKESLNNINITQKIIIETKNEIEQNINDTFDAFILELQNRKKYLLLELNNIINIKNKKIKENTNIINENIVNYTQKQIQCHQMIKKKIELNKLNERKKKVVNITNEIIKNSKNVTRTLENNKINPEIVFIINKNDTIKYLKHIGNVFGSVTPQIISLEDNGTGLINIKFKLWDKAITKLRIEWKLNQNDEKDEKQNDIWNSKDIKMNDDEKNDIQTTSVHINKNGKFIIRLKLFCDNMWSYSNSVSINIKNASLYTFGDHIFTNCGAFGMYGPKLSNCMNEYKPLWTKNKLFFNVINDLGCQQWTVPMDGKYEIDIYGAAGSINANGNISKGARMRGEFNLKKGIKLNLIVGQMGLMSKEANKRNGGSGGGGGSFVWILNSNKCLIVAGGGGGSGLINKGKPYCIGFDGVISKDGTNARDGKNNKGVNGGDAPNNGGKGWVSIQKSLEAAIGANSGYDRSGDGGFGGGGGGGAKSYHESGGGGGYSGGGISDGFYAGGGGGSYNGGMNQLNVNGCDSNRVKMHGQISIRLIL